MRDKLCVVFPGSTRGMMVPTLCLVLAFSACQNKPTSEPAVTKVAPETAASAAAKVLSDPHRFDCKADADCENSCAYGAVSSAWYKRAEQTTGFNECQDGCNNQISEPPRCEAGGCVAYQHDPRDETKITPLPRCTRREP